MISSPSRTVCRYAPSSHCVGQMTNEQTTELESTEPTASDGNVIWRFVPKSATRIISPALGSCSGRTSLVTANLASLSWLSSQDNKIWNITSWDTWRQRDSAGIPVLSQSVKSSHLYPVSFTPASRSRRHVLLGRSPAVPQLKASTSQIFQRNAFLCALCYRRCSPSAP